MTCGRQLMASCLVAVMAAPLAAEPRPMRFRNNMIPGMLTVHRITRTVTRTTPRGEKEDPDILRYTQAAQWTQCNIDEPKPGTAMIYQMMVDQPARVVRMRKGGEEARSLPSAAELGLSRGSTRLHSAYQTPTEAPPQVPLTSLVRRAAAVPLLDVRHWPKEKIEAGHTWERQIDSDVFRGTQRYQFVDTGRIDGNVVARVTVYIEGSFLGEVAQDYRFVKGQVLLYWARIDRMLVKMEARAVFERVRPEVTQTYELRLDVGLIDRRRLEDDEQNLVKDQVRIFSAALTAEREGRRAEALRVCRGFKERWPASIWMPAVDELVERLSGAPRAAARLDRDQLESAIGKAVVAWEAATAKDDYDLLERTERTLALIADEYRGGIGRLRRSKQAKRRALAAFVTAFGNRPEDVAAVQRLVRDEVSRVRGMALAGLAAARPPNVSVELLVNALDDSEAGVRRRACQAVAACVPREHFSVVAAVEKLAHLMIYDEAPPVRTAAVRSLARLGAPADVSKLEKALTHELNQDIRRELHAAIETLNAR